MSKNTCDCNLNYGNKDLSGSHDIDCNSRGNKMDKKLLKIILKIEALAIEARGETTYTLEDLKIRKKLERIQALAFECLNK